MLHVLCEEAVGQIAEDVFVDPAAGPCMSLKSNLHVPSMSLSCMIWMGLSVEIPASSNTVFRYIEMEPSEPLPL